MAETSYPAADGAGVIETTYEKLMACVMGIGRVDSSADRSTTLAPLVYADSSGRQVKVAANAAYILRGYRWESGSDGLVVAIPANTSGKTRIDRIVLRLDRSTWTVRVAVLQGSADDAPVPPALTQNTSSSGVFEVSLAKVTVTSNAGVGLPLIATGDVTAEHQYLMPQGHIGATALRSSIGLGGLYYESDTGRVYFGTTAGDILVAENGPSTKIAAAGGWNQDSIYCQRVNGRTHFQCMVINSGADKAPSTDLLVCTLPTQFRPISDKWFNCVLQPGQGAFGYITAATGTVKITAYPQTFPSGGRAVLGPFEWPSTGVLS